MFNELCRDMKFGSRLCVYTQQKHSTLNESTVKVVNGKLGAESSTALIQWALFRSHCFICDSRGIAAWRTLIFPVVKGVWPGCNILHLLTEILAHLRQNISVWLQVGVGQCCHLKDLSATLKAPQGAHRSRSRKWRSMFGRHLSRIQGQSPP